MSNYPFYGAPAPAPGAAAATPMLQPPSLADYAQNAPRWARMQAYLPEVTMPMGANIGLQSRDYVLNYAFTATGSTSQNLQFSQPTTVVALAAAAYDTSGADLPVGRNPLDLFRVQITRTNGDRFQTSTALGSTIFGTAAQPRLVGPSGWMFDIGGVAIITVTSLIATLAVDLVFLSSIEVRGPSNFVWQAVPFGYVTG